MGLAATWQLGKQVAEVQCAELSAKLDLMQPARGLHDLRWDGQALVAGDLLGVSLIERLAPGRIGPATRWLVADCYSRGADLVVTFAAEGASPVRWQVSWSASVAIYAGERCPVLDACISVQTSALDTHLECLLSSRLHGCDVRRLAEVGGMAEAPCFLFRTGGALSRGGEAPMTSVATDAATTAPARSYIEMVHPADVRETETLADRPDAARLRHHLFDTDLEKGVIVRGRARGLAVPVAHDLEAAAAAWQVFVSKPPPLTA